MAIISVSRSVSVGTDSVTFEHQHDSPFCRARAVHDPLWNDKPLPRLQLHRSSTLSIQVDDEAAFDDVEEFVFRRVLVPMVLTFHDTETNNRVVHFTQRLVEPGMGGSINDRLDVHNLE